MKKKGYPTPKVDVRAVILDDNDNILLVEDATSKTWSLPGGFTDIGISPVENVIKEVKEETGLKISVSNLIAVYDTNKSNPDNSLNHYYKLIYFCNRVSGELTTSKETSSVKYFESIIYLNYRLKEIQQNKLKNALKIEQIIRLLNNNKKSKCQK